MTTPPNLEQLGHPPCPHSRLLQPAPTTLAVARHRTGPAWLLLAVTLLGASVSAADPLSTWHTRTSPFGTANDWRGIAFGNGKFVAVNKSDGQVMTSPNGTDWSPQSAPTTRSFYGIAFGGGRFVAVGSSGSVFISEDGAQWEQQNSETRAHLYHVNFNNGLFVAVGGGGAILSSPDGTAWTPRSTGSTNQWEASCYGNGTHVVVGYRTQSPDIFTRSAASPTLTDWILTDSGASHYLSGVTFGQGMFVAVGYGGLLQTSTDGVQWSAPANATHEWLYYATYDNNTFMAVGEDIIVSSSNGVDWTPRHVKSMVLNGIAYGNGTWVAVGNRGLILQSDPVSGAAPEGIVLTDIHRAGGELSFRFNGTIGASYLVQASADLVNWTTIATVVCTSSPMPYSDLISGSGNQFLRMARP